MALMARQLQDSVRELICRKYDAGKPCVEIAQELEIPYKTVSSVLALYKRTGRIASLKTRLLKTTVVNDEIEAFIKEMIAEDVSTTLVQMQGRIFAKFGVNASITTIHRAIGNFAYSLKRVALVPEARNTEETIDLRFEYVHNILPEDDEKIVYLDEMGICCSTRSRYSRSPVGATPRKTVANIRSQNYSVSAAMHKRGLLHFEVSDRTYDGERFGKFLSRLFDELGRLGCTNALLVMDNSSIHNSVVNRSLMTSAGHRYMLLPPHTPQLNPIEEVFSKWETLIKSRNSQNAEDLIDAINTEHRNITAMDCENYVLHSRAFFVRAIQRFEF